MTADGMATIKLSEVFTGGFVGDLNEMNKGLSVDSTIQQLMILSGCVLDAVPGGCATVHGRASSLARDVDEYGVDAMVNMHRADSVVGLFGNVGAGCCMSISDAIICYSGASVVKVKNGARMEFPPGSVGVTLVEDETIPVMTTLMQLIVYWRGLKKVAYDRKRYRCVCTERHSQGDGGTFMEWLSTEGGRSSEGASDGFCYETLPGGDFQRHDVVDCELLQRDELPPMYAVKADSLKAAVSPGFDRWVHDALGICCQNPCVCWKFGVREVLDVGWMVANQFLCSAGAVCALSDEAKVVLRELELEMVREDSCGVWYDYSAKVVNSWIGARSCGSDGKHGLCFVFSFRMLAAWYEYVRVGRLGLIDVLRGVKYLTVGDVLDHEVVRCWDRVGDFCVSGAYSCPCGSEHEVSGLRNVRKVSNGVPSGKVV